MGALTPSRAANYLPRIMRGIKKISKSVARLDAEVQNTLKLNEELLEGQIKKPQPKKQQHCAAQIMGTQTLELREQDEQRKTDQRVEQARKKQKKKKKEREQQQEETRIRRILIGEKIVTPEQ